MSNQLNPLSRAIADMVAQQVVVDATTGNVGNTEQLFANSLKLDGVKVTEQMFSDVHEHRSAFIAGFNQGVGEAGFPVFKANSDLSALSATANILDDTLSMRVHRSRTFPVPGKDGETVTVYGGTDISYSVHAAGNRGQLKISRQSLKSMYSALAD